jgi:HemY protein
MKAVRNVIILLLFLAAVLGVAILGRYFPGSVEFDWLGSKYKIDITVYLIGILIFNYVFMVLYAVWRAIVTAPRRYRKMAEKNKQIRDYQHYGKVLMSYFTGQTDQAAREFQRLDRDFKDHPLSLMLNAKISESEGNSQKTEELYHHMLLHKETKFVGLKGLIEQSMQKHHHLRALEYALTAAEMKPKLPWLCNVIFDLYIRVGNFDAAFDYLPQLKQCGLYTKDDIWHKKAAILLQKGHQKIQRGDLHDALTLYDQSLRAAPKAAHATFLAKAVLLNRLKEKKQLIAHVKKYWAPLALFEVGQLYYDAIEGDALTKYKMVEKLTVKHTGHIESLLLRAYAAAQASMWAEARSLAELGLNQSKQKRFYDILIMIERLEFGQSDQAQKAIEGWLDDAVMVDRKAGWVCSSCSTHYEIHHNICPHCHDFACIQWDSNLEREGMYSAAAAEALLIHGSAGTLPLPAASGAIADAHRDQ